MIQIIKFIIFYLALEKNTIMPRAIRRARSLGIASCFPAFPPCRQLMSSGRLRDRDLSHLSHNTICFYRHKFYIHGCHIISYLLKIFPLHRTTHNVYYPPKGPRTSAKPKGCLNLSSSPGNINTSRGIPVTSDNTFAVTLEGSRSPLQTCRTKDTDKLTFFCVTNCSGDNP